MKILRSAYRTSGMIAAVAFGSILFSGVAAYAQTITVQSGKPGGVYSVGEKIVWHLAVTGEGASNVSKIAYVLKEGQMKETGRGELTLKDGAADLETTMSAPGSVMAYLTATDAPGKPTLKEWAGALVAPEQIKPSAPPPADFDAFWKSKVEELHKVPMNPTLSPGESGFDKADYWKVTLDNIRGSHIQGQLSRPKSDTSDKKYPALLIVQWAGVYPLQKNWVTQHGANGWLALNINAHDLPIDQTQAFYDDVLKTKLEKNYAAVGNEDKDTSYFLRMYLSCYRAIEYLKSRPDWDGKTLVVMGTSQGGLQTLMIGGLYPGKISALIANVPAGCDLTGPSIGRQAGWPMWWWQTANRDAVKVRETSRYYDVVNFASRITAPALVATGLIDETCPDHGVCAAFNQMKSPKELVVMERSDHQGRNNTQAPFWNRSSAWLRELSQGNPPPAH